MKIPKYNKKLKLWEVDVYGRKEYGDLEYVVGEFIQDSLYYPFYINGLESHVHTFREVLFYALNHYDTFSIEDYKEHYSKQEIEFLNKFVNKLRRNIK